MGKKFKIVKARKVVSFLTAVIMMLMMFAVNPIEIHAATVATAPIISPNGGEYTDENVLSVTITSPDGGDIYYTLDEPEPTTLSTKYTEAIEVSASTTIKAIAVVDGMDNSQVASMTYTISHNHVKSSEWEKDEDNHWHECTKGDGYVFEDSKTTHSYDEGVVTIEENREVGAFGQKKYTCTICSYEKYEIYHTHTQIGRWDNDSENHWHYCRMCPLKMDEAKHIVTAWTVTQEATETEQGSRYGTCDVCGYRVEQVIPEKRHEEPSEMNKDAGLVTYPEPIQEYKIVDGIDSTFSIGKDESLVIRGDGAYSKFMEIKVDGVVVDSSNYSVEEGSTIITLKAEYLKNQKEGSHTIELVWTDGYAKTTFTIQKTTGKYDVPKTGDNFPIARLFVIMMASGGTIIYLGRKKKRLDK